jgi:hypothetical protein
MLVTLLNALFGCSHRRTTFPISPTGEFALFKPHTRGSTYVVCLDCGQEFAYDWQRMHIGEPVAALPSAAQSFAATNR